MPEPPESALLPLPRELRDCIYEYLLTSKFRVMNPRAKDVFSSVPLLWDSKIAILIVSKSTYDEAKVILYRHGCFQFTAVKTGSRLLHREIRRIPDLEKLQDIRIHIDPRCFEHDKTKVIEYGTALINHFAGLDSGVQRKRCVIEVTFFYGRDLLDVSSEIKGRFKDAVGRLQGFKAVELQMWYYNSVSGPWDPRRFISTLCTSLDDMLAMVLGKGNYVQRENIHTWVYHPQQG